MKLPVEVRILASQFLFAPEAQLAEHAADNRAVEGSNPFGCIVFVGSVAKRLMQRPVASPIEGSSPFTPVSLDR